MSKSDHGFTLIELLVVLAIIALLLTIVSPRYFSSISKAQETTLKQNLSLLRDSLDKYYSDTGKYPSALTDLVVAHYIRNVPTDPITNSPDTWIIVPPEDTTKGKVYDVHSGAPGISRDGSAYANW